MAHHKSAKKRIRQDAKKRLHNRYFKKSARTAVRAFRDLEDQKKAEEALPAVFSQIDKLAKRNLWHANKAANLKSSLVKHMRSLG
ncbi:MAG: 30S ribosomal protein S20 [Bacteroidota bacterium]